MPTRWCVHGSFLYWKSTGRGVGSKLTLLFSDNSTATSRVPPMKAVSLKCVSKYAALIRTPGTSHTLRDALNFLLGIPLILSFSHIGHDIRNLLRPVSYDILISFISVLRLQAIRHINIAASSFIE